MWVSINEGKDWVPFKNGFPSVSTMDLVIQEKESALVVGTFGRAIWVLDDLMSLREIVRGNTKEKITALPMNDVVQVKGLFIAPPGNIWTGFGTTFEGENRPFQQANIPMYINDLPSKDDQVEVSIKNIKGDTIQKLVKEDLIQGLNYIQWKLDEHKVFLSGNYDPLESRGIPVLPGIYEIIQDRGYLIDHLLDTITEAATPGEVDLANINIAAAGGTIAFVREGDSIAAGAFSRPPS